MKKILVAILVMFSLNIVAQNPIGFSEGNFPSTLINVFKADNPWLENGDSIYSAFKVDEKYYASMVNVAARGYAFFMANGNTGTGTIQLSDVDSISIIGYDDKIPVKVGFDNKEKVYWGVCRDGVIYQLNEVSKKNGRYGLEGKFIIAEDENGDKIKMEVLDNPYWSLNPVWPENLNYRLKMPDTTQKRALQREFYLYDMAYPWVSGGKNNKDWQLWNPIYVKGGSLKWEMYDGKSIISRSGGRYLNQTKFRIAIEDLRRGYMLLKMTAEPLKNSTSRDTSRIYKIYWE